MATEPTPTDAELTECYKAANGEDVGKAQPLTTQRIFRAMRAAIARWGAQPAPAASQKQQAAAGVPECTCSANDMPFGTCCKVRSAFERWYDEQRDGRLQPFDVFKGGWIERHKLSGTPQPTQAQARAVTLALHQRDSIKANAWRETPLHGYFDADEIIDAVEAAHGIGIKGGRNVDHPV